VILTEEEISTAQAIESVRSDSAGAISTFTGTTRDNFNGKKVVRLEYEAYKPMATKLLLELCQEIRRRWKVLSISILHRLGNVGIGEASVVIAISSVHRKDSLEAVEFCIDELKATVPIWKMSGMKMVPFGKKTVNVRGKFSPKSTVQRITLCEFLLNNCFLGVKSSF